MSQLFSYYANTGSDTERYQKYCNDFLWPSLSTIAQAEFRVQVQVEYVQKSQKHGGRDIHTYISLTYKNSYW